VLHPPIESGQYLSIRYSDRLADLGIQPSTGSVGDSYDNALAESVNGLFKTELIKPRKPWRTVEEVELATLEWVWWFNNTRRHSELDYRTPNEAHASHYPSQQDARPAFASPANR